MMQQPDPNTEKKMSPIAKEELRSDTMWGVVNPGNALCAGVFRTKREAEKYRRNSASAYVVVRVTVTPDYAKTKRLKFDRGRLIQEIYRKNMTPVDLAKAMGLEGRRSREFFQDDYSPGLKTIGRIADALGIDGRKLIREAPDAEIGQG